MRNSRSEVDFTLVFQGALYKFLVSSSLDNIYYCFMAVETVRISKRHEVLIKQLTHSLFKAPGKSLLRLHFIDQVVSGRKTGFCYDVVRLSYGNN